MTTKGYQSTYNPLIPDEIKTRQPKQPTQPKQLKLNPIINGRFESQDSQLDLIEKGLDDFSNKAELIKTEIEHQKVGLDKLGNNVDNANSNVTDISNRTKKEINIGGTCVECQYLPCMIVFVAIIIIAICLLIWG